MWLFIEPNDVLLFRDGKPFAAGEDHRAKSLFPPTPFTMQGVIRAKVLFDSGVSPADYASDAPSAQARALIQQIGAPGASYGKLRLRGPFVAKRNDHGTFTRYFPLPADIMRSDGSFIVAAPLLDSPFSDNSPVQGLRPLWVRTDKSLHQPRGWLAEPEFNKYLQGQTDFRVTPESDLVVREPRLGIALDYTRRATQEGMLYTMEFLRLKKDIGFLVEVDGVTFSSQEGFLQVGGEARAARYQVLSSPLLPLPSHDPLPERFKVVLLTPAWFSGGWQPEGGNWGQFFGGASVRLIAAALPRAQPIGGALVDDKNRTANFQRAIRRFVPAGSVFFFESDATIRYNGTFTETPPNEGNFGQIGFGDAVITSWNEA